MLRRTERERDGDQDRRQAGVEAEELHARFARDEHEREDDAEPRWARKRKRTTVGRTGWTGRMGGRAGWAEDAGTLCCSPVLPIPPVLPFLPTSRAAC